MKIIGLQHITLPVHNIQDKKEELLKNKIPLLKDLNTSSLGIYNLNIIDLSGIVIEFFEIKKSVTNEAK